MATVSALGNQAVQTQLRGWTLYRSHTNAAPSPDDRPVLEGEPDAGAPVPADVNVGFNPMDVTHRLLEAIDQSQVRAQDIFSDRRSWRRHIDFPAVVAVLSHLTADQVKQVEDLYAEHEKPRSLRDDIFGGGESGFPSDLTRDQRNQIEALLGGTVAGSEDARDAESHQNDADAAELHALLYGDLKQADVERVMAILRRGTSQLTELIAAYEHLHVTKFQTDLWHLGVANHMRASLLLGGSAVAADAFKVGSDQYRIREIDAKIAELTKFGPLFNREPLDRLREERKSLVEDVEQRAQQAAVEGRALAIGKGTEAGKEAVRARVAAVLGGEATTVGGTDAAVIAAIANADPASKVAAQLRRLLESDKLTPDALSMALRGLRDDAAAEAKAQHPYGPEAEIAVTERELAEEWFVRLRDQWNAAAAVEGGPDFNSILARGEKTDVERNRKLREGKGRLDDVDELVFALSGDRKDMEAVKRVLHDKNAQQIKELKVKYWFATFRSLDRDLFGDAPTRAGEENLQLFVPGAGFIGNRGKATETDRLILEDYLQRPEHEGGPEEVLYIAARAEREYEYTIKNRGATGWWRDHWGNEARDLLDETIKTVRDLQSEYLDMVGYRFGLTMKPEAARSERAHEIIRQMRLARATIRGDRAAYEKATAELRATFEMIASFVLQAALTGVLGPVAEAMFVLEAAEGAEALAVGARLANWAREASVGVVSTIGANATVYGSDYSMAMLKRDLLTGYAGAIGQAGAAKLADKMLAPVAAGLAAKLGARAPAELVKVAGTIGSMEATAAVEGNSLTDDLTLRNIVKTHVIGMGLGAITQTIHGRVASGLKPPQAPQVGEQSRPVGEEESRATPIGEQAAARESTAAESPDVTTTPGEPRLAEAPERASMHLPEPEAVTPDISGKSETKPSRAEPNAPGDEFATEPTQVTGAPVGAVYQASDPHHLVEAWKLYQQRITADPRREASLLYNHKLEEWAVVQGGPGSVPTIEGMRNLGWEVDDTTVGRHSHPVDDTGQTAEENLLPSGRGGDIDVVRSDSYKREPAAGPQWHAIDVMTSQGSDRTWVFYSRETGIWTVDYPAVGARGGRDRVSFSSTEQYHRWFERRFGFAPGEPKNSRGAPVPHAPGDPAGPAGRSPTGAATRAAKSGESRAVEAAAEPHPAGSPAPTRGGGSDVGRTVDEATAGTGTAGRSPAGAEELGGAPRRPQVDDPDLADAQRLRPEASLGSNSEAARFRGLPSDVVDSGYVYTRRDLPDVVPETGFSRARLARETPPLAAERGRGVAGRQPTTAPDLADVQNSTLAADLRLIEDHLATLNRGRPPGSRWTLEGLRINRTQVAEGATGPRRASSHTRPDVQFTIRDPEGGAQRFLIEYDRSPPTRALGHARGILQRDPSAIVILKVIGFD
jgi:hypothetical protein